VFRSDFLHQLEADDTCESLFSFSEGIASDRKTVIYGIKVVYFGLECGTIYAIKQNECTIMTATVLSPLTQQFE
jgi:hypothetical protein